MTSINDCEFPDFVCIRTLNESVEFKVFSKLCLPKAQLNKAISIFVFRKLIIFVQIFAKMKPNELIKTSSTDLRFTYMFDLNHVEFFPS